MADSADLANIAMEAMLEKALQNAKQDAGEGSPECVECGEEVPVPRQKLGFSTCIECAQAAERR